MKTLACAAWACLLGIWIGFFMGISSLEDIGVEGMSIDVDRQFVELINERAREQYIVTTSKDN